MHLRFVCLAFVISALPLDAQQPIGRFEATVASDAFAPGDWGNGMHRGTLRGGVWLDRLHLFGALTAWGQEYGRIAPGTRLLVASGIDTTFTLPLNSDAGGAADSVDVVFPEFEQWDDGTNPFDRSDTADAMLRATFALPTGYVGARYGVGRAQRAYRSLTQLYNPQGWTGEYGSSRELRLDGSLGLGRMLEQPLTLVLNGTWRRDVDRAGLLSPTAAQRDGALGFETSSLEFLAGDDPWDYDEQVALAFRFDALPPEYFQLYPDRQDLAAMQTYAGISENLRINPFGMRIGFPLSGYISNIALEQSEETSTRVAGAIEWPVTPTALLRVGGDWGGAVVDAVRMTLYTARGELAHHEPTRLGAFAGLSAERDRFSASVEARFDRIDLDGMHPRVPGFVSFLPDTLLRDFMVMGPDGEMIPFAEYAPFGTPLGECAGASVCLNNLREASTKDGASLAASFGVRIAPESRLVLSFSDRMQGPLDPSRDGLPSSVWTGLVFAHAFTDFATGMANGSTAFGRDVELPRLRVLQAAAVHRVGRFVFEGAASHRSVRDDFAFRMLPYTSPVTGADVYISSLVNRDTDGVVQIDGRVDYQLDAMSRVALGYTWHDVEDLTSEGFAVLADPVFEPGAWTDTGFGPGGGFDRARRHLVEAEVSILAPRNREGLLADAGVLGTIRAASGLPYRSLINFGEGRIGPPYLGGGTIDGEEGRTPWVTWLALRAHKSFRLGPGRLRAFAEWSGPLGANQSEVFLETGTAANRDHREILLAELMGDQSLDGDAGIDDVNLGDCMAAEPVVCEVPGNALNAWSLIRAEDRYGDGDGVFTVAEQRRAFAAWYDLFFGEQTFRRSDRSLRLGLELRF